MKNLLSHRRSGYIRYSVLTYNIQHYEVVHEIIEKDPEAEYLLITDDQNLKSDTWEVIYDERLEGLSTFDKCYSIRFDLFRYCHSDICVRIDGNIGIKRNLKHLVDIFENGNYDAALMPHPLRDNFIDEYNEWVKVRAYPIQQAERCLDIMRQGGYDFNYKGLFQLCFSINRKGRITSDIDRMTIELMKKMGKENEIERIDQIPFSYIMNKYFSHLKILPVSEQIIRSPYMTWYNHGCNEPNNFVFYDESKDDIHYMFNKQVKCIYMKGSLLYRIKKKCGNIEWSMLYISIVFHCKNLLEKTWRICRNMKGTH